MSHKKREVAEGMQWQGEDESIAYTLDVAKVSSNSPSGVSVAVYAESDLTTDLAGTLLSGSASVDGTVITLPLLLGLTDGVVYRMEVTFTLDGNTLEVPIRVRAER